MPISTLAIPRKDAKGLSPRALRKVQKAMARDGALRLSGLFPRPVLERLRASVLRRHESGELKERGLVRDIGGRYAAVLPFEGPFLDPRFYANPALHRMLAALLGPSYCIGSLETVVALPGAGAQHQHIDAPIRFDRSVGGRKRPYARDLSDLPPYAVTLCVPLCDVDEENGPTAIWPGSHRLALRPKPPGARELNRRFRVERMTGRLGEAFFFDYRTFHCGTPNFTREARAVLMFVFTRSWFRDPNLSAVHPRVLISKRNLEAVPEARRELFMLAPAARRPLWEPNTRRAARRVPRGR